MKPQKRKTKKKKHGNSLTSPSHTESTPMADEIPSDIDRFGLPRRALPTQPPPPLSRLSLNGNASVLLSMADINSRMMTHSPHSSKSNDAIYSQDISTITASTRTASSHHFNIDELYVKSQPMMTRRNMGKRAIVRANVCLCVRLPGLSVGVTAHSWANRIAHTHAHSVHPPHHISMNPRLEFRLCITQLHYYCRLFYESFSLN